MHRESRGWSDWTQRALSWSLVAYFALFATGLHYWGPHGGPMRIIQAPLMALVPVAEAMTTVWYLLLGAVVLLLVLVVPLAAIRVICHAVFPPRRF